MQVLTHSVGTPGASKNTINQLYFKTEKKKFLLLRSLACKFHNSENGNSSLPAVVSQHNVWYTETSQESCEMDI